MASGGRSHLSFFFFFIFLLPAESFLSAGRCHPDDRAVVFDIQKALGNPSLRISWDPKDACSTCLTVSCNSTTLRINSLVIEEPANVSGIISPSIGKLTALTWLAMTMLPGLSGTIPPAICELTQLQTFILGQNQLSGSIPACLSRLRALTYINLSYNQLTGPIPASLAQLPKLEALHLEHNQLTGQIPDSFGRLRGSLTNLYLSNNNLTGQIPASLGAVNFWYIDLSNNRLEGSASMLFGSSKTTEFMDISWNLLAFDFSNVTFPSVLDTLKMEHNQIYGVIPSSILQLTLLRSLNVSYNPLCGRIPQGSIMNSFDASSFSHSKCLCGPPLSDLTHCPPN